MLAENINDLKEMQEHQHTHGHNHSGVTVGKRNEAGVQKKNGSGKNNHDEHKGHSTGDFKKRFFISLILTIPILFLSHMFREFFGLGEAFRFNGDIYVLFLFSTAVYFYGGYPFLSGIVNEFRKKQPGMMTLIAIAITTAYSYSTAVVFGVKGDILFWELATLIDIMLLGHWIEMKSVNSASRALEELVKLLPDKVHLINHNNNVEDIPISQVRNDYLLLVKPGEKIPADSVITEGSSSVNESMITGESAPVYKKPGDLVIGGSINGEGSLKIKVTRTGDESFLSNVIRMVKDAQQSKSRTQNLASKAALWLTITSVLGGVLTMLVWLLAEGSGFNFALTRAVTVMVIACPHALGLAIPLVVAVSGTLSARNGLLIKNRTAFEEARKINAVVFDKTGTLTKGEFGVTDVITSNGMISKNMVLKYAASIESESEHPIAKGIVNSVKDRFSVEKFKAIPGKGAEGIVNGKNVKVVSPGYLTETKINSSLVLNTEGGKTAVYVIIDDQVSGAILLADEIKEESKSAINELREMGIKTFMITGDSKSAAEYVSAQTGIDEFYAGVLPGDKSGKIKELKKRGLKTAMVGDGVNDAPALAMADVGIAIGAGTDVAAETADIILVRSNPRDVVSVIKFARITYKKMIQNLIWATGYNLLTLPLAAGILYNEGIVLSPAMGAVFMSLSTIIVAINARLLRF